MRGYMVKNINKSCCTHINLFKYKNGCYIKNILKFETVTKIRLKHAAYIFRLI